MMSRILMYFGQRLGGLGYWSCLSERCDLSHPNASLMLTSKDRCSPSLRAFAVWPAHLFLRPFEYITPVPPINEPPSLVMFATIGSKLGVSISKDIFFGSQVMNPGSPFAAVTKDDHGRPWAMVSIRGTCSISRKKAPPDRGWREAYMLVHGER
jgi:hypothetical protein